MIPLALKAVDKLSRLSHLYFWLVINSSVASCAKNKVLLGLGGTGSYILYSLAAMGVGFIRAIDFDIVQRSNLSRKILYGNNDIGKLKIDCAKDRIISLDLSLNYEYINKEIREDSDIIEIIEDMDFCILSADTPRFKIKEMFSRICYEPIFLELKNHSRLLKIEYLYLIVICKQ